MTHIGGGSLVFGMVDTLVVVGQCEFIHGGRQSGCASRAQQMPDVEKTGHALGAQFVIVFLIRNCRPHSHEYVGVWIDR